ncbi:MAG: hypothetical protein ACPG05_01430 [Bdellovibrionales bacterium]
MARNIDLCELENGTLMIVTDSRLPADACRIEYYKDQKLLMLVYDQKDHEGDLMTQELPEEAIRKVILARKILVVAFANDNQDPDEYTVPLIQIGV